MVYSCAILAVILKDGVLKWQIHERVERMHLMGSYFDFINKILWSVLIVNQQLHLYSGGEKDWSEIIPHG